MAEVDATFNYDADFSSAISEVKKLAQELSALNSSFNSLDKNARKLRDDIAQTFVAGVGDLGAFSAKTVDISTSMDHFGKSLDQGKLKLRDYYREATRAFTANSNAQKLAVDQIRKTRSQLVQLGIDPTGRNKGILVTPLKLDMSDMNNQLAVARKQFDIFNALVQGGATKLINFGKNTQWAGRQLTVGITVPMSIFASTVTKAFMDVDAELTRFQKVYGSGLVASTAQSTAQIRGQVQAMATDIAKQYGVAAKETAGLAADLAATGLEGQNLLTSLKQTTRLAVLGEVDRQTAMKATLAIQNAFKVSSKDLADQINFLNAVENQTSTSLVDLTEAIPKAGPVIKALGGDVKDLSLLLVAMKEGGIGVAEGANSIKSGLASLINPTKAAIDVGKQYGINIEDIVKTNKGKLMPTILSFQNALNTLDDFSKAQVIEKIFGKYQFARMSALFDNLNASGSQTKKVIELMSASNSQLAAIANQEIKTLTESASMRFKRSMEAIRASLLPVGETILRSVLPYLEKFSSFIDKVVAVGKNLPEPIKQFIKFGTAITAIAGPLVMIGGVLANFLGYVQKGAMGFVNLGRRMAGLPTHQFELLTDEQIAAAKATDVLTLSIDKQKNAMIGLNALMRDYVATLIAQREATPGAFNTFMPITTIGGQEIVPSGKRTLPIIKRQSGGSAWVPGSGSGDKIPALLEPGEFVVNRNAASQNAGLLQNINSGIPRFAIGGVPESRNEFLEMLFAGKIQDMEKVDEFASRFGVSLNRSATGNPSGPLARIISSSKGYSTYNQELDIINRYISDPEKRKNASQMSGSHIVKDSFTAGNFSGKVWRGDNLSPDLQIINQVVEDLGIIKHPVTPQEALALIDKIKSSNHPYKNLVIELLESRLKGNYYAYAEERRGLLRSLTLRQGAYKGQAPIGITSQYFRNRYNQRKANPIVEPMATPRQSAVLFQRVSGPGRFKLQSGGFPWVPGNGSGDRVPAMLEPGEFVVNKNAAMKYGGLLHDINFNQAPRFAVGGKIMGAAGTIGVATQLATMLPGFQNLNSSIQELISKFMMLSFTVSLVTPLIQKFGGIGNLKTIGKTGLTRAAGVAAKVGTFGGRIGMAAEGAGVLGTGATMGAVIAGGAAIAGVAALGYAVYKYRQEIEKSKKAAQEAFSVGKDTATAYGVEIQNINDKLKENQDLTNSLGMGKKTVSLNASTISEEKMNAIKSDNANLIGKLNNSGFEKFTGNIVTGQQQQSMLTAKFATLRQQGFSQADALEVVTGIAKQAGTEAQNALYAIRPQLLKITGETQTAVFKSAQDAQIESLKNMAVSGDTGSSQAFQEAFKGAIQSIQYAPPQDQLDAMNNFIKNIDNLSADQITQAGKALADVAKQDYGSADSFTKTLTNLANQGTADSLKKSVLLDTAKRLGMDTMSIEADFKVSPEEQKQMESWLKDRKVNIDLEIRNQQVAQNAIDDLTKKMNAQNAAFDNQMSANDKAVEKENNRYKNAAKASAKFIKEKQKEVDAINKGADTYIKSLERESKQDQYIQSQRKTALSGLQALTQGDVLGFLASKQEATANAQQYAYDQEIQQIDDKRKKAVDALQAQIDKENERQANAEEHHQKILDNLDKQRQAYIKTNAAATKGIQDQIDMYGSLQSKSGAAYTSLVGNFKYVATEAEKASATAAAMDYLLTHPNATVDQAIAEGNKFLQKNINLAAAAETNRENNRTNRASGGHITGPGTGTSDSIPAMLSNGEYVVRASAVKQYGVDTLDAINAQRYANGGVVRPAAGGITNHYGTRKPYYHKNPDSRGWGIHTGTDFAPGAGSPVLAFEDGTIVSAGFDRGWGNHIKMKHSYGPKYSYYAHLSKILRSSGYVSAGTRIGSVGNTGTFSRGAHLHFETGNSLPYSGTSNPEGYLGIARAISIAGRADASDREASSKSTENLNIIAKAFGTTAEMFNQIKERGMASVLTGRRFGGSMTMNKPYLVGENGPEVVTPYGFGGKVYPIKYNVPHSALAPELVNAINSSSIANSSSIHYNINVDAAGMSDPESLAKYIVSTIRSEENARSFGRKV